MPSEGKSGSFFFFTHDNKFIIKTISDAEKNTFLDGFAENYYEHVVGNQNSGNEEGEKKPQPLLCRIYGVYTLKIGFTVSVNLILMENVFCINNKIVIHIPFTLTRKLVTSLT